MRRYIAVAIMMAFSLAVFAQNQVGRFVSVVMNDGTTFVGEVTEQNDEHISLKTISGDSRIVYFDSIRNISDTDRPLAEKKKHNYKTPATFNHPKGYYVNINTGVYSDLWYWTHYEVKAVGGYRFCPQFAIGLGTGLDVVGEAGVMIPLFVQLRSDFLNRRVSPFISADIGYNFYCGAASDDWGYGEVRWYGLNFEGNLGVSFNVDQKHRLDAGLLIGTSPGKHHTDRFEGGLFQYTSYHVLIGARVGFSF